MSVKLSKKWSSKKKKPPKNNVQTEVLIKLGLEAFLITRLDPTSMLNISTWTLNNQAPLTPKDLPWTFLRRLWLLSPDARSTCCKSPHDVQDNSNRSPDGTGEENQCAINPLDLVTAVYMSANTFLQQEITTRMVQCQFAVPLVLPNIDPEEPSHFLLWPLRGVVSQWRSHLPNENSKIHEGNLASTYMPLVSCVKLGHCGVSKSKVLNKVLNGLGSTNETFLHRGMDGGELPRRLSNGLIEIGWYLPRGDKAKDIFPVPVVMSNVRGDVSAHEKYLYLLCQTSSAVVVFCGNLREKDKQLLASCKNIASKLIVIDLSDTDRDENRVVGFVEENLEEGIGLPRGSMMQGGPFSEEELANRLCNTLKNLLPDELKLVTLEAAAKLAEEVGLHVDEGAVCKRAMATVEEVLKGLDEGSAQYKEKQLPLQGPFWSKLAQIEKEERKQKKEGRETDPKLRKEKKGIFAELRSYKMTPAMKMFTDALFNTDKVERACFLSWMKLKLQLIQIEKQDHQQDLFTNLQTGETAGMAEQSQGLENGFDDVLMDDSSFYTDSSFEDEETEEQPVNTELQVSEQQSETGLQLKQILQSAENTMEQQSQEKEDLESTDDSVMGQQLNMTSNEKEIQDEGMAEITFSFEEEISDPIFDDQNHHQPGENGTLSFEEQQQEEPELMQAESDMTSSTQQQICQNVSLEHQKASSSQPFEVDSSSLGLEKFFEPGENGTSSFKEQKQDEPELTLAESDMTSSTQQQICQNVSLESQETSCSQPFEVDPSSLGLEQFLEPGENRTSSFEEQQQDEPELMLAESDMTSSTQQQICQNVSLEHQESSCSQPFEDDSSSPGLEGFLEPGENGTSSFEEQQQDEPELTLAESDMTSSTQQQICQNVPFEHQEASCSQPFEVDPSSLGLEQFLEPGENRTWSFEEQQQDEPELMLAVSDMTSSTQQQICQNVSLEHQDASCSQSFEVDASSLGLKHFLEPREDGTSSFEEQQQDEPELTLAESDITSSTQQQICQNVSLEHQEASCSQPFEVDSSSLGFQHFLEPGEDETSSFEEQQKDEPELTLVESDMTLSTQQQICQNVSWEHQEASCSQPFEVESSSLGFEQFLEPGENGTSSFEEQQQDEPELTLAESDMTSSTQEQICQNVSLEHQEASCSQPFEVDPSSLGLEHFLREMGLIFELTHISPGSGSQNVLRLPSLATDLLLYGIPLELMDGDASNIPMHWLGCVFAELKRRLPQERHRARVLTNLGVHHARNAEVLSAVFGVKFPEGRKRSTRGVYMALLFLPDHVRKYMECDFLLLIDVEGLCSDSKRNMLIQENEMATVATGLSDVLMENICSHAGTEHEINFTVMANALLRIKESGSMPICQLLAQGEGIHSILQASQLRRISDILQSETGDKGANNTDNHCARTPCSVTCIKGPWYNMSISEPVDAQYSKAVLKLKQNLFRALKKCAAKSAARGLPEFMSRLCAVWDAVRAESFSIGLQNTDIALAFSLLCTELSPWEDTFMAHVENWLAGATKKVFAMKAKALDAVILNGLLSELKDEVKGEVKTEVNKIRSKLETYLKDNVQINQFKPLLMSYMDDLQEQVTEEVIQRLETLSESHCSSTQLQKFETLLDKEQESKLCALIEKSRSTKVLLTDEELENEFESVWNKILSDFDFRPSEKDDITARVGGILKANLVSRGLKKHMKKLEEIGQNKPSNFYVYDEHFGYRSRLKHMFEDNNRVQRLEAQQLADNIIEECHQFVAEKCSSPADFSDSYITELLKNVDKALKKKSKLDIRSVFEVELKIYVCTAACQNFQKLHDLYAKDSNLLTEITSAKCTYLAQFIYLFRKRDQCQRVAQAFTSMVVKPTVLDYIHRPLGMCIVEEIQRKAPQYKSQRDFHQGLLEELIKKNDFESFLEYLHSYDNLKLRKIQETVEDHISESTNLDKRKQQRLGEIIGMFAAAVSETAEGTNGVLSDTKPLLERVLLTVEKDGDVDVSRASLDGPFFSITTEWDRFITCLMEFLAALRLELAQGFSQNVDGSQFLQCLPIKPHEALLNKLRGCDKKCPVCKAPCELKEVGHEVHRAMLHRPEGMLPHNPSSLYSISCPRSMTKGNPGQSNDIDDMSLHSLYPDWSISCEDHMPSVYWRYVLARFSERFAMEYEQEPVNIPEKWMNITEEEALNSLREAFLPQQ